ncbi:hypothetical protein B0O99DRAFT_294181 [Bisporella sp. PMI_857]|nr:hypothetical protein B0O99DRAFT_294181 [Bisporella sp. PMI_857]
MSMALPFSVKIIKPSSFHNLIICSSFCEGNSSRHSSHRISDTATSITMRSLTLLTIVFFSATMTIAQQSNLQLVNPFWDVSDQTAVQASLLSAGPTDSTYVIDCRPSAILTATDTVNDSTVITTTPCASNWMAETYTFVGNTSLHFTYSASYGPVATAGPATATVLDVAAEYVSRLCFNRILLLD